MTPASTRAVLSCGGLGALALAALNALNLLATGYARLAERDLDAPSPARSLAAAAIARDLTPWSSPRAALHGWALAQAGDADAAEAAYAQALRWAPGDPLIWAEYALVRARAGRFDDELTHAVRRAAQLAPQSPAIQQAIAALGLSYWSRGTPDQRALWLEGMRHELARDRNAFLSQVLTRGQGVTFCAGAAKSLGESAWCARMGGALSSGCYALGGSEPTPCRP